MFGLIVHRFNVAITDRTVIKPRTGHHGQNGANILTEREKSQQLSRYPVFGLTARILVDVARIAYDEVPEFEYNSRIGDEIMVARLNTLAQLDDMKKPRL
jgi:hypothetical protein